MRMSCPHNSPQNGRAERIIHTTNDIMCSLLFQASLPVAYWVEALHTTTYLLNFCPTKTFSFGTPHFSLFGVHPDLSHLRVLGCKCCPNLSAIAPHKIAPRSTICVFLGYPSEHKGYRCLDLTSNRLIILWHVTFAEASFPFTEISTPPSSTFDFLLDMDCVPLLVGSCSFTGAPLSVGAAAPDGLVPQTAASSTDGPPTGLSVAAPVGFMPQAAASRTDALVHPGTALAAPPPLVVASNPGAPVTVTYGIDPTPTSGADSQVPLGAAPVGSTPLVMASVTSVPDEPSTTGPTGPSAASTGGPSATSSSAVIPAKAVPTPLVDNSHAMHT
jgi:hypothetical protein